MCGIFGVIGNDAYNIVKLGLERVAYRGYDSAGITVVSDDNFYVLKCIGHPEGLMECDIESNIAIGHTRWSTSSTITIENAHPHRSNNNRISLVHNGIVENYTEVKAFLESNGFEFYSETDTEVLPNLIQYFMDNGEDLLQAIMSTSKQVRGAYAIAFIHLDYPEQINIVRNGSPICIGKSSNATYISSDINSMPPFVNSAAAIENGNIAIVMKDSIAIRSLDGIDFGAKKLPNVKISDEAYDIGSYAHFLEKEIFEQPKILKMALAGRVMPRKKQLKLGGITEFIDKILNSKEIIFTGCGSALYAAKLGAFAMETIARKRCRAISAGELQYYNAVIDEDTVLIAVSQSGETADTIGCINNARNHSATILGIVNTVNSTIANMVDAGIYIRAGNEISVASTKAVLNQITAMVILAAIVGVKKDFSLLSYESLVKEFHQIPKLIERILSDSDSIKDIAKKYAKCENMICIGYGNLEPIAYEAALKVKEISYVHAEGFSSTELKHGSLALIAPETPTIAFVAGGPMSEKILSSIMEIKSRNGKVIAIIDEKIGDDVMNAVDDYIIVPRVEYNVLQPLLFLIPAQLLAYYMAVERGCSVDRPRHLAKSVTVG